MNTKECGVCAHFWAIKKGLKKGTKDLAHGHCLKRSVFPKGKPGNPVFPPGAIIQELPDNRGKPYLVRKDDVVSQCTLFEAKA